VKLSVPYLGMLHKAYGPILRNAGVDVVLPPRPTKRTLDLGTKHAPEFACLPFKITLGSMIEALELGADSIFMPGGWGPCRFGYFDVIQEQILKDLGYSFTMGSAKNPDDLPDMLELMQRIAGLKSRTRLYKLFFFILVRLSFLDWALKKYFNTKPYEALSGETDRLFEKAIHLIENSFSFSQLLQSALTITVWFRRTERKNQLKLSSKYAKPYLRFHSGGESIESVGKTVLFTKHGIDGVIHMFPFTCMPELVAQTILMKVHKDLDIPILTLIIDEHTAPGGVETRLDAFIDLLERRRRCR
jgi:predicted nucleotide-binding protein (sugar kinase/HSP70/actin superfamily)